MGEGKSSTNQAIKIVGATTLTLAGINIESTNGAAIEIAPNASFDVSILLADGSENELVGQSEAGDGWNGSAAIQKNGADSTGTLVIGVPNNSLGTGSLVATGGKGAAGIGGGYEAGTRNITFTGGSVKAYAGRYGAAIGGGSSGTGIGIKLLGGIITAESLFDDYPNMYQNTIGSGNQESFNAADNMLDGDVVLIASGPSAVLGGFSLNRGIYFEFNYGLNPFVPFTYSYVFENVTISENVELPLDLIIPSDQTVTIGSDVTLTMASGKSITVEDGANLINASTTLAEDFPVTLNGSGTLSSEMNFYRQGALSPYLTNYQVYKTASGVQNYTNLPNPDTSNAFLNWYYLNDAAQKVAIYDGDPVLLNEHNFYEESTSPDPAPEPTPDPTPGPTPDVTPASGDASLLPLTGDMHPSLASALLSVAGVGIALLGVAGILKTRRD